MELATFPAFVTESSLASGPGLDYDSRPLPICGPALAARPGAEQDPTMKDRFERHRQPWTPAEIQKLHQLVEKGMSLKAISKSMTRSEESIKARAKIDKLKIAKKR